MSERHILSIYGTPSYWQSRCSCTWESRPHVTRPEAIREHTVHAHGYIKAGARR